MHVADVRGWGRLTGTGGGLALSEGQAMAIQAANANLIAAAPDLLDACVAMVERFGECGTELGRSVDDAKAIEAARAAIAKAKGGAA